MRFWSGKEWSKLEMCEYLSNFDVVLGRGLTQARQVWILSTSIREQVAEEHTQTPLTNMSAV